MTNSMKLSSEVSGKKENMKEKCESDKEMSVTSKDAEIAGGNHGFQNKHSTTYLESLIHFVKGNIGSGVFAMSEGFKIAGIIVTAFLTVILGLFCLYGEHLLVSCSETLKERKNLPGYSSFGETVQMSFANGPRHFRILSKYMKPFVDILIAVTHLGFCCVYFIFISSTSQQVLAKYGIDFNVRLHMIVILLPLVIFSMVRRLKYLVPLSLIANICLGFGIAATVYLIGFDLPPISSRRYIGELKDIPLVFGTIMYSFEGIGLVMPLKSEMKVPENFDRPAGVLNVGMFTVITVFSSFGFLGYLHFGDNIQSSITLSLDPDLTLSICVKVAIAVGIMFTYCLMFFVAMTVIWPSFNAKFGPFKRPLLTEVVVRFVLVLLTFILAEGVPHIGLFISLIGAFSTTLLGIAIPVFCDISLRWPSNFGNFYWRLVLNIIALIISAICFFTGTYYSLKAIFITFFFIHS